jgi:hypothetical protein
MLFPTPPQFRKRRGRGRVLAADPVPPSGPLTVIAVISLEDGTYRFAFSGTITISGGDVSSIEVGIAGDDLWFSAGDPVVVSATEIDINIGSSGFPDWRILTQPVAIVQELAVPMSGVVA